MRSATIATDHRGRRAANTVAVLVETSIDPKTSPSALRSARSRSSSARSPIRPARPSSWQDEAATRPSRSSTTLARIPVPSSPRKRTASSGVRAVVVTSGQNTAVALSRIAWLVTVVGFALAAVLLFLNGYVGYFLVLLAVAVAAAVNLR